MKTELFAAIILVTMALIAYAVAVVEEYLKRVITGRLLVYLTLGLALDFIGTYFMSMGNMKGFITIHGIIGITALIGMLTATAIYWIYLRKKGLGAEVPRSIHLYTIWAFAWWCVTYISGGVFASMK